MFRCNSDTRARARARVHAHMVEHWADEEFQVFVRNDRNDRTLWGHRACINACVCTFQATFQTLSCSHTECRQKKPAVGMEIILDIPKVTRQNKTTATSSTRRFKCTKQISFFIILLTRVFISVLNQPTVGLKAQKPKNACRNGQGKKRNGI